MIFGPYSVSYALAFGVDGELGGLPPGGDGGSGEDLVDGNGHGYGEENGKVKAVKSRLQEARSN